MLDNTLDAAENVRAASRLLSDHLAAQEDAQGLYLLTKLADALSLALTIMNKTQQGTPNE